MVVSLVELASLENCSGFLSIDSENFEQGLATFAKYPGVFKLALLQEREDKLPPKLITAVNSTVKHGQVINFPYHRAGRHVPALQLDSLINCPQVTSNALPLQVDRSLPKPCQSCALCLPK